LLKKGDRKERERILPLERRGYSHLIAIRQYTSEKVSL